MKKNLPVLAAFVLALVAAILVFVSVKSMQPTVPVLVAARNLSVGDEITPSDVALKRLPAVAVPGSALRRVESAVGKTVAYGPVLAGEIVRSEHISDAGSLYAALRAYASSDWAAVELPADTAVGMKGLRRGDKVDIYGEVPYGNGTVVSLVSHGVILQNLEGDEKSENKRYVVAVPANYAPAVADIVVRGRKLTLVLPGGGSGSTVSGASSESGGVNGEAPVSNNAR